MQAVSPAEPVAETAPAPTGDEPQAVEPVAAPLEQPAQPAAPPSVAKVSSRPAAASANPALEATSLSRTVDALVSPQASHEQKAEAWKYLGEAGKLDQAIAELERRTANDPRSADNPAALGHAYLQKCGTIKDVREQGILAMQADKMFDTALSLDSANWEARFMKAVAMSYWPPMLNKGDEVIQHFQTLIEQQEVQTPQPHFADTYAWLGDQYQKAGRADDAKAVWQRGAVLFPADEKLRTKLASKP
jgi:tetratricopeptide (TPR) repeat protein